MKYYHVDVFSNKALAGNGLTVIWCTKPLESEKMQKIAQEFKQFETIFVWKEDQEYRARIFTVEEELDFAGHPILGLGAVIHLEEQSDKQESSFKIKLDKKEVVLSIEKQDDHYKVKMNQGKAEWGEVISKDWQEKYCRTLHISEEMLDKNMPMAVVSTGLPYLLVPICKGIEQVKITTDHLEALLDKNGAKFAYIFNTQTLEGRTWDNFGSVEDVATGSAAGPVGAYLYKYGRFTRSDEIILHQGKFVGRPSEIYISCNEKDELLVAGDVKILVKGESLF